MTTAELCRATAHGSQKALTQPTLWAIEEGQTKNPSANTLFRLAAALNANPGWIRTGAGDPFILDDAHGGASEVIGLYASLSPEKKAMILAAIKAIS